MGHSVPRSLPTMVIYGETNLITLLRDPWKRIQSDYYYTRSHPNSSHLGPNINMKHLLLSTTNIFQYLQYPGISNCVTKVSYKSIKFN